MINETRKILELPYLPICATCVRVPIVFSHSIDIYAEFENIVDLEEARSILEDFENIIVIDNPQNNEYPLATIATGKDEVFVGRIRNDLCNLNALTFFCVADNVRKGAASNAIEIMEFLCANSKK